MAVLVCRVVVVVSVLLAMLDFTVDFTVPVAFVAVHVALVPATTTVAVGGDVEDDVKLEVVESSTVVETSASRLAHLCVGGGIVAFRVTLLKKHSIKQQQCTLSRSPITLRCIVIVAHLRCAASGGRRR